MEFENVGAGWWKVEEGKASRYSVKLNNGMYMSIFKNKKKEEGSNQPDINITMSKDDAEKLGLVKDQPQTKTDTDEVDIEEIPF